MSYSFPYHFYYKVKGTGKDLYSPIVFHGNPLFSMSVLAVTGKPFAVSLTLSFCLEQQH